jgi:hypothetical protein
MEIGDLLVLSVLPLMAKASNMKFQEPDSEKADFVASSRTNNFRFL